jgi:hypothetical protein
VKIILKKVKAEKLYIDNSIEYTLNPLNFFGIHNHFQGVYKTKDSLLFLVVNKKIISQRFLFLRKLSTEYKFDKKIVLNSNDKNSLACRVISSSR